MSKNELILPASLLLSIQLSQMLLIQRSRFAFLSSLFCRALLSNSSGFVLHSEMSTGSSLQSCNAYSASSFMIWLFSDPLLVPQPFLFHSPNRKGLAYSPFLHPHLTRCHFFTLSKALSKQSQKTAGLVVSWLKSLFSVPMKSLGATIHWQC